MCLFYSELGDKTHKHMNRAIKNGHLSEWNYDVLRLCFLTAFCISCTLSQCAQTLHNDMSVVLGSHDTHDASAAVATQHSHITLNCPCVNSGVSGNYYFIIFNIILVSQFDMSLTLLSFSSTDAASDNGSVDGVVKF